MTGAGGRGTTKPALGAAVAASLLGLDLGLADDTAPLGVLAHHEGRELRHAHAQDIDALGRDHAGGRNVAGAPQ